MKNKAIRQRAVVDCRRFLLFLFCEAPSRLALSPAPDSRPGPFFHPARFSCRLSKAAAIALTCATTALAGPPDYPEYAASHWLAQGGQDEHGFNQVPAWQPDPNPGPVARAFEPLGTQTAAAACQVADVLSTELATRAPGVTEQNPMAPQRALEVLKLAFAAYIKWGISPEEWQAAWLPMRVFITAVGCGAALNNVAVWRANR